MCVVQQGGREEDDRACGTSRVGLAKGHLATALLEPVLLLPASAGKAGTSCLMLFNLP